MMICSHCGGLVWPWGDDLGERCLQCGRSPEPPITKEQLEQMGVAYNEFHRRESEGHGSRALEFEGFHQGPRGHSQSEMGRRVRP